MDQPKTRVFVDVTSRVEHAVGPEYKLAVIPLPRKTNAFVHQPFADTQSTRLRFNEQKS